ncbi:MAG: DUF4102 domain-containing protein [Proteobacteria bacterium]|nr:DUF4102 domain-containing protein [Pseudomonadota bacterium]
MILKNKSGRFTDKGVKALRHEVERYEVWEAHQTGLGLRVSALPNKHKSWQFTYSFVGKKRRLTLGRYPAVSVEKANSKLLDAKRLLDDGIDPAKKRKAEKKADREAKTVRDLSKKFLNKLREKRRRTVDEYERVLEKDVLPELGDQKPRAVTRADVADLLDGIVERGSPIAANRTLAITRRMFVQLWD